MKESKHTAEYVHNLLPRLPSLPLQPQHDYSGCLLLHLPNSKVKYGGFCVFHLCAET